MAKLAFICGHPRWAKVLLSGSARRSGAVICAACSCGTDPPLTSMQALESIVVDAKLQRDASKDHSILPFQVWSLPPRPREKRLRHA